MHRRGNRDDGWIRKGRKKNPNGKRKELQEETTNMIPGTSQDTNIEEPIPDQAQNKLSIWEWIKEGKKWLGI